MSDCHEFIELPTEHIYALDLDNINGNSVISLDPCLGCLPRAVPVDGNTIHVPFVRVSFCRTFPRIILKHSVLIDTTWEGEPRAASCRH